MNVCNTSPYGDTPMPNMVSQCQIKNNYGPDTKTCQKPYKFDLDVKVQGHTWIMDIRDTSSHGDTPMCLIWGVNVKPKTKLWAGHEYAQTDGQTDRQSDT